MNNGGHYFLHAGYTARGGIVHIQPVQIRRGVVLMNLTFVHMHLRSIVAIFVDDYVDRGWTNHPFRLLVDCPLLIIAIDSSVGFWCGLDDDHEHK